MSGFRGSGIRGYRPGFLQHMDGIMDDGGGGPTLESIGKAISDYGLSSGPFHQKLQQVKRLEKRIEHAEELRMKLLSELEDAVEACYIDKF